MWWCAPFVKSATARIISIVKPQAGLWASAASDTTPQATKDGIVLSELMVLHREVTQEGQFALRHHGPAQYARRLQLTQRVWHVSFRAVAVVHNGGYTHHTDRLTRAITTSQGCRPASSDGTTRRAT